MGKHSRRSFLAAGGAALASTIIGTRRVSAVDSTERYIVDTRDASPGALSGVEVVHDLDQIDIAVVRGSESDLAGVRAEPDLKLELSSKAGDSGPAVERDSKAGGPPENLGKGKKKTNDPLYDLQWDKQAQDVPAVHTKTRGEGTSVAIIDSGILPGHPDLQSLNEDLSRNFTSDGGTFAPVDSDHGTHCAGIVAATDDNGEGVVGTAPGAELLGLRVFSGPYANLGDILAAIVYAGDVEADVANLSLGAYPVPKGTEAAEVRIEGYTRAANYANSQGTLMVAAAGNDSANLDTDGDVISLPNEVDNYMSISATGPIGYRWGGPGNGNAQKKRNYHAALNHVQDETWSPAFYTNYGESAVDISAPGGDADLEALAEIDAAKYDLVLSTTFDDSFAPTYSWKAGTSMAAPAVSGVAALIRSLAPDMSPQEVREHLIETATPRDPTYHGEGHLDTKAALDALE
ncbi:Serine protease, subtilisin family [Haladaptatus litoreus]|uniref:Serine protease, subtilisin family n=1 Tax=Haladaptatus litoreus TaxID=553468 RepID=A0A1N7E4T1_9EURY|nr:S8 family serine peptidase [Haladaptatus litoreus]SIR82985.1 Serine protease, subtilisin family [Haladaptatus litoreus]